MSITVREVWELKEFQAFQLVAGEKGLDNRIDAVGILDYEYALQDGEVPRKWTFRKYDFVISSLLFAKDRPDVLLKAVQDLCHDQVGALAVKNVCYRELPSEVLEYADEKGLPIFMFGRDDAYFEDIVVCLKSKIAERDNLELQEHRISLFLRGELDLKGQRELNRELLPNRVEPYRILYCFIRGENGEKIRDYRRYYLDRERSRQPVFYYRGGCFAVIYLAGEKEEKTEKLYASYRDVLLENLRMPPESYWIGAGEVHEDPEELLSAMKEAICAEKYAQIAGKSRVFFRDTGIWQILLPCWSQEWFQRFSRRIIQIILEFDRKHDGDLYQTAEQYVKKIGNIQEVAETMHLHKNTVRYRINKVRELLDMEEDASFDMQIFMAFMIDELNQLFKTDF